MFLPAGCSAWAGWLLLQCGDVETHPGPFPKLLSFSKAEDPVAALQEVVDDQDDKIRWGLEWALPSSSNTKPLIGSLGGPNQNQKHYHHNYVGGINMTGFC